MRIIDLSTGFSSSNSPTTSYVGVYVAYATETISGGGTIAASITDGFQLRPVVGSGAVTTAAALFGALSFLNGQVITLIGTSDTNTVTIAHSDVSNGPLINGDIVLTRGASITLQWVSVLSRFIEIGRNV